jgi:hypothetical protein
VPADAVELLTWFAAGQTVGEVRAAYKLKYGALPDLDDFLNTLRDEGFLGARRTPVERQPPTRRYHFENIPVALARRVVSPVVLAASGGVIALGLLACAIDPRVLPPATALVFERDALAFFGALVLFSFVTRIGPRSSANWRSWTVDS